jgi:hypothetical protein
MSTPHIKPDRKMSPELHGALLDLAHAAVEAAAETEVLPVSLALVESAMHRVGAVLAQGHT